MRMTTALMLAATMLLVACQQGQANSEGAGQRVAPEPIVEPIDPATDPVAAVKARKQQMSVQTDLGTLRAEIMALIGEARADNVQQCRVVGFGAKPCGGPASYIALSVKDKNESQLMSLIDKYNAEMKAENDRLGRMSDCAVVPKPGVVLENGICTLTKTATGEIY